MDWTGLEGKKVFIITKRKLYNGNNIVYSGIIKKIIDNPNQPENYSIQLLDKFSKIIILERYDIVELREE